MDNNVLDTAAWHVEIFSRRVHIFGGVEIYVNGPCFKPTDTITCTFGSGDKTIDVTGTFFYHSSSRINVPLSE